MGSEVRTGRISSVNYETGMARVTYRDKDETVTAELPVVTNNDEYRMPEVGQSVLVAHLSNGSSRGVVIGTLWNQKHMPQEAGKGLYRKELSRKKDAAYIRYSDETGEYLLKAAGLHLNGINTVVLDGPELEIGANISLLLTTDQMHMDCQELSITGGEAGEITAGIAADINIQQEGNGTNAVILKMVLELLEGMEIRAGETVVTSAEERVELSAGDQITLSAGNDVDISAGGTLRLSDGRRSITLEEIIDKLGGLGEENGGNR